MFNCSHLWNFNCSLVPKRIRIILNINMLFKLDAFVLQERCIGQNVDLYKTYVDLTKAFDTINRDGLWKIMASFGCPPRFIAVVRKFHDGMQARLQNNK